MTHRSLFALGLAWLAAHPLAGQGAPMIAILVPGCPVADSLLGPRSSSAPLVLHGILLDGGQIQVGLPSSSGSVSYGEPSLSITVAAYPAPLSRLPLPPELLLGLTGAPATQLRGSTQPVHAILRFKADTVGILGTFPTVNGAPAPGMVMAFVSFPLRPALVARIVTEKDALLEWGPVKIKFSGDLRRELGDAYRGALCGYQPSH